VATPQKEEAELTQRTQRNGEHGEEEEKKKKRGILARLCGLGRTTADTDEVHPTRR
jgi:hypothetical protein